MYYRSEELIHRLMIELQGLYFVNNGILVELKVQPSLEIHLINLPKN
jgi:hypothetical protein